MRSLGSPVYNDEVLARWAAVMISADLYAELIDRHFELADSLDRITKLLNNLRRARLLPESWGGGKSRNAK